jgi:orotidine-5'-phosphate decarboxylase
LKFRERMLRSQERNDSRVVLALDFSGPFETRLLWARRVLAATKGAVAAVKVNHHLLLPYGLQGIRNLIRVCKREQLPLIADLKLNDIESTNLNAVDSLLAYGFDAVIANPFVGREEGLGRVIDRMHAKEGGVILLVYMSHRGAEEGYGLRDERGEPLFRRFAARAKEWGADGVVVSAKSVDKIRETRQIVGNECLIFSPGIGPQGGEAASGAARGADFMIVGRSVTESADPAKALRNLTRQLFAIPSSVP